MIIILGANGQLGSELHNKCSQLGIACKKFTKEEIDITQSFFQLDSLEIDCIINCAAYTKVDDCDKEETKAFEINAISVKYLAQYCLIRNIPLVHISTDYVFGQEHSRQIPYKPDDLPGPLNTYGLSKLNGEYYIQMINPQRYLIVRTCGVYSHNGHNFVQSILGLKDNEKIEVISDQVCSPTFVGNLADIIIDMCQNKSYNNEILHCVDEGECSWYDLACSIYNILGIKTKVVPINTDSKFLNKRVNRPRYSVLENHYFSDKKMMHWKSSIEVFLESRKLT